MPTADHSESHWPVVQMARQLGQAAVGTGAEALANLGQQAESLMDKAGRLCQVCEDRLTEGILPAAAPARATSVAPAIAAAAARLVLLNDREAGETVQFVVNGHVYLLRPGEKYESDSHEEAWLVRFHRGGNFGNAQYTLSAGAYVFHATERGWDLSPAAK